MNQQLLHRAEILIQQKRFSEAADLLQQLLTADPNNVFVMAMLAEVKVHAGELQAAERHIDEAIGMAPDLDELHFIRAQVMLQSKRMDDAEKDLETATSINPTQAQYFALWAHIKLGRKRPQEALELAEQALALDAHNILAVNARSTALLKLDRKSESFATIEGALREDPNNAFTHANYGWSELEKGDHRKALGHFKESLRHDPTNEYAQAGMIQALKARYLLYRWFLQYSFWMANLTAKYQWAVIIGFYVAFRLLRGVADSNPGLAPFLQPILVLMGIVAFSTWVTTPLSNLFLRLNIYGKHLLSRQERLSSNLVGVALIIGLSGLIGYLATGAVIALAITVYGFGMMVPCSMIFLETKRQFAFPIYCGTMAVVGLLAIVSTYTTNNLYTSMGTIFLLAFVGFQWFANFVMIRSDNS
ncbi:MAG: tetratricopeptide repeat protein [Bacteroidota bacterium]